MRFFFTNLKQKIMSNQLFDDLSSLISETDKADGTELYKKHWNALEIVLVKEFLRGPLNPNYVAEKEKEISVVFIEAPCLGMTENADRIEGLKQAVAKYATMVKNGILPPPDAFVGSDGACNTVFLFAELLEVLDIKAEIFTNSSFLDTMWFEDPQKYLSALFSRRYYNIVWLATSDFPNAEAWKKACTFFNFDKNERGIIKAFYKGREDSDIDPIEIPEADPSITEKLYSTEKIMKRIWGFYQRINPDETRAQAFQFGKEVYKE